MRPVETVAVAAGLAEERDQGVESAGPLAGLRGVLAAEPEISQLQRPGPYAIKLQVTDMQQARAEMMDDLVKGEGAARSVPRKLLISSQHLLQIIIALLIFLAVLSPLFIETTASVTPTFAPETGIASQIIDQLSVSQPVLVAIDYQPANSGEMDAIGSAVMDHLMLKGAYLALVSTVPSGPVQAMHLVEAVNQSVDHQYSSGDQFVNLGYIPGGRNGLATLVNDPQQLLPYDLSSGRDPWTASPLQSINSLADFGLLVVMTDSAETARAWIEQVQPALEGTPLIMVNSAQIDPVVRPYYNAIPQQVQAMVTGLPGGVAYENLLGRTGVARSYWASFNMGLLAAFFAIIIGGVIMLIPVLRARMSKKKGAARAA